jgi:DNA-binding NtrC family response regulator
MKQKVIMIVDDMSSSLEIMKFILAREGFTKILTFDCPLRALHEIEQGVIPDIIISDYHMHEMNGVEFLQSAISDKKSISAIIISGDTCSIENCPETYIRIDKGDYGFFKKLLSAINTQLYTKTSTHIVSVHKPDNKSTRLKYSNNRKYRKSTSPL